MRFLGLGDNVVDHYLSENIMYPGGNAFNFAVFAKKIGYESAYLGVFGDDEAAALVRETADILGVETHYCSYERGPNGRARVQLIDGDRKFLPSSDGVTEQWPLKLTELQTTYCCGFDLIHSSCYSFCEDQLPLLKERGCRLSFDFSDGYTDDYLKRICPNLFAALLSAGHLPDDELDLLLQKIHGYGVTLVLLTRGSEGSLCSYRGRRYTQSPCYVKATDTMAAGDAFSTAFLCTFLDNIRYTDDFPEGYQDRGITNTEDYTEKLIQVCLHKASVFSSQNCLVNGSFGFGKTPVKIRDRGESEGW